MDKSLVNLPLEKRLRKSLDQRLVKHLHLVSKCHLLSQCYAPWTCLSPLRARMLRAIFTIGPTLTPCLGPPPWDTA